MIDILRSFIPAYVARVPRLRDLEIEACEWGKHRFQYVLVLRRYGDYGAVGHVEVTPVNDSVAWVHVTSYSGEGPWERREDRRVFAPVNRLLLALTRHLHKSFIQGLAGRGAANAARKPGGRPHLGDDIWAWEQVKQLGRPSAEVYKEWIEREGVQARNFAEPKRQFKRIMESGWRTGRGQNL